MVTKKKTIEVVEETVETKPGIGLLGLDLGREDLNLMVAKINELVKKANE